MPTVMKAVSDINQKEEVEDKHPEMKRPDGKSDFSVEIHSVGQIENCKSR